MIYLSRSATLDGFTRVARDLGLDPHALVDEVGLPPACLSDADLRIPTIAVTQLYNLAAERAGIDNLGLRVAQTRQFSNLGAVGLLIRAQPTVRKAIEALAENIWAQAEGLTITVEEDDDIVVVRVSMIHGAHQPVRQMVEIALAVLVYILRRLLGAHWAPEMVMFSHKRPASMALHLATFGRPPMFLQEFDGLILRAADFDTPIPDTDDVTAMQLTRYLEFAAGRRTAVFAEKVQRMISTLLPQGNAQADHVARLLGMDRRTLHRQLARHGTSFSALVQRERIEMAEGYIDAGDRSLTEIADLLGFSCLSAFSRWKKRSLPGPVAGRGHTGMAA